MRADEFRIGDPVRDLRGAYLTDGVVVHPSPSARGYDPAKVAVKWRMDQAAVYEDPGDITKIIDRDKILSVGVTLAAQPTRRLRIGDTMHARRMAKEEKGFKGGRD